MSPSKYKVTNTPSPSLCPPTALLGTAGVGLGSSLGGSAPGGQPSAPNLNPPSQIDPSSIERAYAALGLTYQGTQVQPQVGQASMPGAQGGLQGQPGMRPLNAMGKRITKTLFPVPNCPLQ